MQVFDVVVSSMLALLWCFLHSHLPYGVWRNPVLWMAGAAIGLIGLLRVLTIR